MQPLPTLTTARLQLRPIALTDAEALHGAMRDPVAMQYWREPAHESLDVTRGVLEGMLNPSNTHWAILEKGRDGAIGFVGFHSNEPPHSFGYFLSREYWRRGYMLEACTTVLSFAFESLGYRQAEAWIHERNAASLALAGRLGFRDVGRTGQRRSAQDGERFRFLIYGLWADDFAGRPRSSPQGVGCELIEPTLVVTDVSRSIAFYTEILDCFVAFKWGEPTAYAAIRTRPWTSGPRIRLKQAENGRAVCRQELLWTIDDVAACHAKWTKRTTTSELVREPWGAQEFSVEDPDGHTLRFTGW